MKRKTEQLDTYDDITFEDELRSRETEGWTE